MGVRKSFAVVERHMGTELPTAGPHDQLLFVRATCEGHLVLWMVTLETTLAWWTLTTSSELARQSPSQQPTYTGIPSPKTNCKDNPGVKKTQSDRDLAFLGHFCKCQLAQGRLHNPRSSAELQFPGFHHQNITILRKLEMTSGLRADTRIFSHGSPSRDFFKWRTFVEEWKPSYQMIKLKTEILFFENCSMFRNIHVARPLFFLSRQVTGHKRLPKRNCDYENYIKWTFWNRAPSGVFAVQNPSFSLRPDETPSFNAWSLHPAPEELLPIHPAVVKAAQTMMHKMDLASDVSTNVSILEICTCRGKWGEGPVR